LLDAPVQWHTVIGPLFMPKCVGGPKCGPKQSLANKSCYAE